MYGIPYKIGVAFVEGKGLKIGNVRRIDAEGKSLTIINKC